MKTFKRFIAKATSVLCVLSMVFQPGYAVNDWASTFGGLTQIYNYNKGMASNIYDAVGDKMTILRAGKQWKTVYRGLDNSEIVETEYQYDKNGDMLYAYNKTNDTRTSYDDGTGVSDGKAKYDQTFTEKKDADGNLVKDAQGNVIKEWVNTSRYNYNKDGSMMSKEVFGYIGDDRAEVDVTNDGIIDSDDAGYAVVQKVVFSNGKQQEVRQYWGQEMRTADGSVTEDETQAVKDDAGNAVRNWVQGNGRVVQKFLYHGNQMKAAVAIDADGDESGITVYVAGKEKYSVKVEEGKDVDLNDDGNLTIGGKLFSEDFENGIEIRDSEGTLVAKVASETVYKGSKKVADVSYNIDGSSSEDPKEIGSSGVSLFETTVGLSVSAIINSLINTGSYTNPDTQVTINVPSGQDRTAYAKQWAIGQLVSEYKAAIGGSTYNGDVNMILSELEQVIDFSKATIAKVNGKWVISGVTKTDLTYGKKNSVTYYDNHSRSDHKMDFVYEKGVQTDIMLAQKWVYNDTGSENVPGFTYPTYSTPTAVETTDASGNVVTTYRLTILGNTIELPTLIDQGNNIDIKTTLGAIANEKDTAAKDQLRAQLSNAIRSYLEKYVQNPVHAQDFEAVSSVEVGNINIDENGTFTGVQFVLADNMAYKSGAMMYSVSFLDYGDEQTYASITYYTQNGQQKATYDFGGGQVEIRQTDIVASSVMSTLSSNYPVVQTQLSMKNGNVVMNLAVTDLYQQVYNTISAKSAADRTNYEKQILTELLQSLQTSSQKLYSATLHTKYDADNNGICQVLVSPSSGSDMELRLKEAGMYNKSGAIQWTAAALNNSGDFVVFADRLS